MKRTFLVLTLTLSVLMLASCGIQRISEDDIWVQWTREFFQEAFGEEGAKEYDAAIEEYKQAYEYLDENRDLLTNGLKEGVADIIDQEVENDEYAEMVKEGSFKAIDELEKIIFNVFDPVWPAETYQVNTLYCYKDTSITGSIYHSCHNSYLTGIDIGGEGKKDVKIYAVEDGKVILSEYSTTSGFGNWIKIQHENGMVSVYAHLKERNVEVGDTVEKKQVIGIMGNTSAKYSIGTHLHFELADENKGGDAWLEYYKDKYKKELMYESNVITNNEKNNKDHVVSQWIRDNYVKDKNSTYYYYKK